MSGTLAAAHLLDETPHVRHTGWTIFISACTLVMLAHEVRAQTATAKAGRTTLSGIYTSEQASRGKEVYFGYCRSCHTPASHTGATFRKWWAGRQMSDLFEYVSTKMPKNEPGSLDPDAYADVIAYLMKMNVMPTGKDELSADTRELKKIRIVTRTKGTKP